MIIECKTNYIIGTNKKIRPIFKKYVERVQVGPIYSHVHIKYIRINRKFSIFSTLKFVSWKIVCPV